MKTLLAAVLAAGVALVAAQPAAARDGCGRGFFRGPAGHCRPMGGAGYGRPVYVAPGLIIGNFYAGRGYWDGRRYYAHRQPWRGGYRYR